MMTALERTIGTHAPDCATTRDRRPVAAFEIKVDSTQRSFRTFGIAGSRQSQGCALPTQTSFTGRYQCSYVKYLYAPNLREQGPV